MEGKGTSSGKEWGSSTGSDLGRFTWRERGLPQGRNGDLPLGVIWGVSRGGKGDFLREGMGIFYWE